MMNPQRCHVCEGTGEKRTESETERLTICDICQGSGILWVPEPQLPEEHIP